MNDTVSVFFTVVLETLCPFTTKSTLSPTSIPGAFNLKAPVSSNLEVSIVFPFFLISIVEDGVAYPVTNPEFATTRSNFPRLVFLSIGAERRSDPSSMVSPLRESRDPVLAIVFLPSFTTFSGVPILGIEDNINNLSLSVLAAASTSACVNPRLLLLSTLLAVSKSAWIATRVEAGAFSLLTLSKSS